jgi:hypothetical protein
MRLRATETIHGSILTGFWIPFLLRCPAEFRRFQRTIDDFSEVVRDCLAGPIDSVAIAPGSDTA